MISVKKAMLMCMVVVLVMLVLCTTAVADLNVQDYYGEITDAYKEMLDKETWHYQLEPLQDIIKIYEDHEDVLQNYNDAVLYYYYALGRVYLHQNKYEKACYYLKLVEGTSVGVNAEYYYTFSYGKWQKEIGNFKGAIECFKKTRELRELVSESISEIEQCNELYKKDLLFEGDALRDSGYYSEALERYQIVMAMPDREGKARYEECVLLMNTVSEDEQIVVSLIENADGSVLVEWTGGEAPFTLAWHMNSQRGYQEDGIAGRAFVIENAYPNSLLSVVVSSGNELAGANMIKTHILQPFVHDDCNACAAHWRFYHYTRNGFMTEHMAYGTSMAKYIDMKGINTGRSSTASTNDIVLRDYPLDSSVCFLSITLSHDIREYLEKGNIMVLMHIGSETYAYKYNLESDCVEYVVNTINKMPVLIFLADKILAEVYRSQNIQQEETAYSMDVLVDNMLLLQINGKIR